MDGLEEWERELVDDENVDVDLYTYTRCFVRYLVGQLEEQISPTFGINYNIVELPGQVSVRLEFRHGQRVLAALTAYFEHYKEVEHLADEVDNIFGWT